MRAVPTTQSGTIRVWRLAALVLLAFAQLFDYVSFMVMIEQHGLAAELNPIVVTIHQQVGIVGLTVVKAAAVVFLASPAGAFITGHTLLVGGGVVM